MAPALERRLIALAFMVYGVLVAIMTYRHGMWLDELQPWCVALDSGSLTELYANTRFEGHPPLWYVILFCITRITSDPRWMQVVHVCIGLGTAAVVLWRAPFRTAWRVLIVFGYFFLYEYTVIARNYGLVVLFLLLAADVRGRKGLGWPWAALLCLAALAHLWGILFAGAWALAEYVGTGTDRRKRWSWLVMGVCLLSAVWCIPDHISRTGPELAGTPLPNAVARVATITTQGLLPWPDLMTDRPWNHNLLHDHSHALSAIIGVALLFGLFYFAPREKSAYIFLLLVLAGGIGLPILGGFYSTRHYAPVFFALLLMWWWMPQTQRKPGATQFMTAILGAQVIGGALSLVMGCTGNPLSRVKELPALLRAHHLQVELVVVEPYTVAPAVSGYLQLPVYRTTTASMGSWCDGGLSTYVLNDTALLEALEHVPSGNFIWCTARPDLREHLVERTKAHVELIGDLTAAQVPSERILVFHVQRP